MPPTKTALGQRLVNALTYTIWNRLGPMYEVDVVADVHSGIVGKVSLPLCLVLNINPIIWEQLTDLQRFELARRVMGKRPRPLAECKVEVS